MFARTIDAQARWVATWLHSRTAFVQLVYGSLLWIPFVALGIDGHGFLYLYVATTLSLITQVPLAMLSYWAAIEARSAERNQLDTMKLLVSLAEHLGHKLEEIQADLEEEHPAT